MLPNKFWVNWPFGSGEKEKNRLSRWRPCWLSWISDEKNFSYIWSTSHSEAYYQVSRQMAFRFRRSKIIDFHGHCGHLGFRIRMILAIFDLQVTPMFPTKNQDYWPFGSGEEKRKIDFLDSSYGGHFGFPIGTILASFYLQVTWCFQPRPKSVGVWFRRRNEKYIFKMAA